MYYLIMMNLLNVMQSYGQLESSLILVVRELNVEKDKQGRVDFNKTP